MRIVTNINIVLTINGAKRIILRMNFFSVSFFLDQRVISLVQLPVQRLICSRFRETSLEI